MPATRDRRGANPDRVRQELTPWLRLTLVHGVGPAAAVRLLSAFGSPVAAVDAGVAALSRHVPPKLAQAIKQGPTPDLLARTLDWAVEPGNRIVTLADADYPRRLLEIADPPPLLYLKGNLRLLDSTGVAIVGSRSATPQGIDNAAAFARELSQQGFTIVSGLALGIDTAAHEGGLAGRGSTIAVVGTGLDTVYPARNHALAHRVAQSGLLVSEFPLGTPPLPANFPRRNRIISGLARGVLVVEAALQSGSLITAREAAEQGREVFAIPGSIHAPLAKGCHRLIRQGAKLVETAADIVEELGPIVGQLPLELPADPPPADPPQATEEEAKLLAALGHDPADLDTLLARSGLTADQACAILLTLELDGRAARLPGGRFQRLGG